MDEVGPGRQHGRREHGSDYSAFGPLSKPAVPGTVQAIFHKRLTGIVDRQMRRLGNMLDITAAETLLKELKRLKELKSAQQDGPLVSAKAKRFLDITVLALGVLRSARSVVKVCGDRDIDSGYVLARTMAERAVSFSFLAFADDEAYGDWIQYSQQKAIRLLSRVRRAGSTEFRFGVHPAPDTSQFPELQRMLEKFTGTKGGEKTRWTQLSLDDQLAAIEGKFDDSKLVIQLLLQALTHVYELGAEAQHGTLLGVGLNYGLLATPNDTLNTHINIVLIWTSACLHSTILVLAHLSGKPDTAEEAKEDYLHTFEEMVAEAEGKPSDNPK